MKYSSRYIEWHWLQVMRRACPQERPATNAPFTVFWCILPLKLRPVLHRLPTAGARNLSLYCTVVTPRWRAGDAAVLRRGCQRWRAARFLGALLVITRQRIRVSAGRSATIVHPALAYRGKDAGRVRRRRHSRRLVRRQFRLEPLPRVVPGAGVPGHRYRRRWIGAAMRWRLLAS